MDQERQIRFLYPPIIVLAFFLWGFLADTQGVDFVHSLIDPMKDYAPVFGTAAAIFAGGSVILVLGLILGTLTYLPLRLIFKFFGGSTHEIPLDQECRAEIAKAVTSNWNLSVPVDDQMSTVWLDFNLCGKGTHEWITRRWNAFNVSANIVVGLGLTMLVFVALFRCRTLPHAWHLVGFSGMLGFTLNAWMARDDTMRMFRFAALMVQNTEHAKEFKAMDDHTPSTLERNGPHSSEEPAPRLNTNQDKSSPVWDMSQERVFMETLLNQRFNFFLVFVGLILNAAFNIGNLVWFQITLWVGFIIALLLAKTIYRSHQKMDTVFNYLRNHDAAHPMTYTDNQHNPQGSARWILGYGIPVIAVIFLALLAFAASMGWISPKGH